MYKQLVQTKKQNKKKTQPFTLSQFLEISVPVRWFQFSSRSLCQKIRKDVSFPQGAVGLFSVQIFFCLVLLSALRWAG